MIKLAIVDDDARLLRQLSKRLRLPGNLFCLLFNSGVEFVEN